MDRGLNMKKKLKTGVLIGVSVGLVIMIIVIGLLLSKKQSQITTIKKTKASAITYNKIIDLNQSSTNSSISPTIFTPLSSPTVSTPTTGLLADANISPTQPIIPTATIQVTNTIVTPTKNVSLPVSGRSDYLISFITVASVVIFFSLVF